MDRARNRGRTSGRGTRIEPDGVATGAGVSEEEEEEVRGSRAIQKGEQPRIGRADRTGDERGKGGHSRPAPVVKRNGAKRTRRTSVPAAWEEEIERREGNGPLERAFAEQKGTEGRGREREREGGEGEGEMRVRWNELKRNAREYTYISGVRETPKEAREDRGWPGTKGERGR